MAKPRRRSSVAVVLGTVLAVVVLFVGGMFLLAVLFWYGLDHSNMRESDVKGLRGPCGIGGEAFSSPESATGSGFQEHTYTYEYLDLDAEWVDRNVLYRFGVDEPASSHYVLPAPTPRSHENVNYSTPEHRLGDGTLIYQSPMARSEMGTTTFDVYRSPDGTYSLRVECRNSAGVNYVPDAGVVTTVA